MDSARRDQLRHDMGVEWWRASEADNFSLKEKLLRVGCRPLKRKMLACKAAESSGGNYQRDKYYECQVGVFLHAPCTVTRAREAWQC